MTKMEPPSFRNEVDGRKPRKSQVTFDGKTKYTMLPGEDPSEFESLHKQLTEHFRPVGPLEEDDVLTIAKGIWRKWRHQRFMFFTAEARRTEPGHTAYDRMIALVGFYTGLDARTGFEDISKGIGRLEPELADHLNTKCARDKFKNLKDWVEAIKKEVTVALEIAGRCRIPREGLMLLSSTIFTDEELSNELEFEARIDKEIERAQDRIWRSQARRQESFREVSRVGRSNSVRLSEIVK